MVRRLHACVPPKRQSDFTAMTGSGHAQLELQASCTLCRMAACYRLTAFHFLAYGF